MLRSTLIRTAIAGVAVLGLAGCGGGGDQLGGSNAGDSPAPSKVTSITVGSADFSESQLLAEIYGQALAAKGIEVKKKPNIGNRETYMAAIKDGSVDLVPEYTGAALAYFDKNSTETDPDKAYEALKKALTPGLEVLDKSPAADEDTIVVTKATADKYSLKSLGDLKGKNLVAGGSSEFKVRSAGLKGLKEKYGVEFKEYKTLDAGGPLSIKALTDNQIQVTNLFTTQAVIKDQGLVQLDDPENILPPNNIVPLIRTDHKSDDVVATLNAVDAKLTTDALTDLVKRIDVGKESADAVAKDWLSKNPLS
ncbi:ABC transporter substrate-binding protein [Kribbella speibonae]|uniref:ABC transporter substrate-binding protein n=1 Tax=Kribbella speibonae TaxID=1572660 RepID=A0A4R0JGG1_9ACTN|nr:ABC transporter substrate-binding protein [Kribbella speibonae]TCC20825.1 ABC transporter substrate-binding protein [Kribbella speibonae]TCC40825.1 ABC transporter substrate-binding protein [Kribbella speibonae]